MPTAAKLFSGVILAIMAMIVSELFKPQMPEGYSFGSFTYVNGAIAFVVGWRLIGRKAGAGLLNGVNNGIAAVVCLIILTVFVHAFRLMLINSTNLRYDSTAQAFQDCASMMVEFGRLLGTTEIIIALLVGAVAAGLLSETVARRWR